MPNAYRVAVGDTVHYLAASPVRWRVAKVTGVVSQTSLNLAIVNRDSTRTALNAGAAVAKRTSGTQTNVWRRY